jgi:hypothetical protein
MSPLRLPEFIIAGAPRSGTTWLYQLADLHPQITMARPMFPEPKFFLRDDLYAIGLEHYSRTWFCGIPTDQVAGEKSTNYLESATAAERIAADLPGVKLVFILRDPVERAFSNYLWSRQNGMEAESFAEALAQEDERERHTPDTLRFARPHALFSRGLYADLLAPYFRLFAREQILVLRYESIVLDPAGLTNDLHRHLGVHPRPQDSDQLGVINAAQNDAGEVVDPEIYNTLRLRYLEPNERLATLVGSDFTIWNT